VEPWLLLLLEPPQAATVAHAIRTAATAAAREEGRGIPRHSRVPIRSAAPAERRDQRRGGRDGMAERAAIVTGASSGIGLAIAKVLAEEGHDLTVVSRRPEKLEPAAEELRATGASVEAVPANLTQEESVREVVQRHRDAYGRLDVLVNNAG